MSNGVGITTIAAVADADCAGELLSVAVAVKVEVPLCVATPVIVPPVVSFKPAGRLPEVICQS
jgi:hypothetical protein